MALVNPPTKINKHICIQKCFKGTIKIYAFICFSCFTSEHKTFVLLTRNITLQLIEKFIYFYLDARQDVSHDDLLTIVLWKVLAEF